MYYGSDTLVFWLLFSSDDPPAPVCPAKVQSVDDFVPDERLDKSFLEDNLSSKTKVPRPAPALAVDSDRWDVCQYFSESLLIERKEAFDVYYRLENHKTVLQ